MDAECAEAKRRLGAVEESLRMVLRELDIVNEERTLLERKNAVLERDVAALRDEVIALTVRREAVERYYDDAEAAITRLRGYLSEIAISDSWCGKRAREALEAGDG